jgi:dihydropteroate synthase
MHLQLTSKSLDLSVPQVMGILNVTPDSFSDGGRFMDLDLALQQAETMLAQGARILDIGGESTRPGAQAISLQVELDRVLPVISAIQARFDCLLSIDTSKAEVMRQAVQHGADMINDVRALRQEGALAAAAALQVPVCLMHMQGEPGTMQRQPAYADVLVEVKAFFAERIQTCEAAGIGADKLILDPGFGFGKRLEHNLRLLDNLDALRSFQLPILVGLSRKSMLGALLGDRPVAERVQGSVVAAVIAAMKGARILRVHDVGETVDAMQIVAALLQQDEA